MGSGSWYRDVPEKRREYHYSGSVLAMKFTEADTEKSPAIAGSFRDKKIVWGAPVAGGFWIDRKRDAPRSMVMRSTGDLSHSTAHMVAKNIVKSSSLPGLKGGRIIDQYA